MVLSTNRVTVFRSFFYTFQKQKIHISLNVSFFNFMKFAQISSKRPKKKNPKQHAEEILAKETVERTKVEQIEKESLKVTMERRKVPVLEYQTLRENRVEMVNELLPENIIPHLKENKVIDQEDVEKIEKKCKDLKRKGSEAMLNIVYSSGRWAFEKLIEVLQQTDYQELAQKLTVDFEKKAKDPPGIEIEVLIDNHERLMNELDSNVLKNHLFQNNIIDKDDLKKINKEYKRSKRGGAEELLNIIYNSGSDAFLGLIKALAEAGYKDLSSKLRNDFDQKRTDPNSERGLLFRIEFGVLKDNHERLVDELDPGVLKNHLFQINLIDEDDLEKITKKEEELRREAAEEMLNIIYYSGSNVFFGLLKSLAEAGYGKLSSKLLIDFTQKKDLVAFPDCPVIPKLVADKSIIETLSNIESYHEVWCFTMRDWFKNHKFKNNDALKMVVKYWLCKLEEVIEKGCLGCNMLIAFAEQLEDPYRTMILQDLKENILNLIPQEDFEPESISIKALLYKQQRRFFKILKHNLEAIIEGKQIFEILPIDTESIGLDDRFQTVVYDVREIWNKLHQNQTRFFNI